MTMQKKASLLALYQILNKHSDEQHQLKRKDIERLLDMEYDIKLDRKTLYDHIELLNAFGCDIQTPLTPLHGYYIGERLFESSEVHLLSNAIHASHFIPDKASNDLIKKLLNTQSKYMQKEVIQTIYTKNSRKTINKEFFLNIELINEAIQINHVIVFDYMKYNLYKQLVPRKDHVYVIHPYYIIYANENYYLICKNDGYDNLSHYRIDKIKNLNIDYNALRKPLQKSFDPYGYAKSKIYMYGGDEEQITLKCSYNILDDIIDRFGSDTYLQTCDDNYFYAIIKSSRQGIKYLCLQYLQYCEVTAPSSLRDEMLAILDTAINKYKHYQ